MALLAQTDSLLQFYNLANQKYKQNKYTEAISIYEKILSTNHESADLYYNLGNSYFKSNNIAKSILYYERGLKLSPKDADILNNLKYANLFVKDEFNDVPEFFFDKIFYSFVHFLNSNWWIVLSVFSFIISLSLFLVFLFSRVIRKRKIAFFLFFMFLFISGFSLYSSIEIKNLYTQANEAIIIEINTLKSSPEVDGTDLYVLNPGVKVRIKSENSSWFEVILPNGKIGWLRKNQLEVI